MRTAHVGTGEVFKTRRASDSPLFAGSISKELLITITVPVFRSGEVIYDLSFNPSLAELQRMIERQRPSEHWTLSFFDQNRVNFARVPIRKRPSDRAHRRRCLPRCSRCRKPGADGLARRCVSAHRVCAFGYYGLDRRRRHRGRDFDRTAMAPAHANGGDRDDTAIDRSRIAVRLTTRLARAEAMHSLWVDELNHRVKNTLQTVQSIAAQTFRHAKDIPERCKSSTAASTRWGGRTSCSARSAGATPTCRLVDSALEPFRGKDRQRVHASGPNLPVAPQSAVMISMMLHELATNAAKYGALSNDTGEVFVDWRELGQGSSRRVQLSWQEAAAHPSRFPERKGFGTALIQRGLTAQLGGKADIEFAPGGLRCTVECPVR